LVQMGGGGPSN